MLPPAEVVLPPKSRTALRLEAEETKRAAERAERERRCQLALSDIKRKQQLARERSAKQVHAWQGVLTGHVDNVYKVWWLGAAAVQGARHVQGTPCQGSTGKGTGSQAVA